MGQSASRREDSFRRFDLDVAVAEVHPGVGNAHVVVHPLDAAVEVDAAAVVLHVVDRVVDVDPVVLVGQVSLQLVPAVLVHPELVVDLDSKDDDHQHDDTGLHLLECPLHPGLALSDLVHLPPQAALHAVTHEIDLLAPLPGSY